MIILEGTLGFAHKRKTIFADLNAQPKKSAKQKQQPSQESNRLSDLQSLAKEWHPRKNGDARPSDYSVGSNKKVWWLCKGCRLCGRRHEWHAYIHNRTLNSAGCPYCQIRNGKTCICGSIASHPTLSQEFDVHGNLPFTAEKVSQGSDRVMKWRCLVNPEHGVFSAKPKSRTGKFPSGCPQCANERLRPGLWHQMLAIEHPRLSEEWRGAVNVNINDSLVSPATLRSGSAVRAHWECSRCRHRYEAEVKDRALKGTQCPKCGGKSQKE